MKKNIEEIIKEYENNINNARKYNSYINEVREYNGYVFKEINDSEKFKNESQWLKELMNLNYCTPKIIGTYKQKIIIMEKIKGNAINLESMCIGDRDYDFTRMLNLLNQKEIYQYEDFKNLIDGYRSINNLEMSGEKWQLYNKFYAFRMYYKMLTGKINRDSEFEEYLKNILIMKHDRVTEWTKKYNLECKI